MSAVFGSDVQPDGRQIAAGGFDGLGDEALGRVGLQLRELKLRPAVASGRSQEVCLLGDGYASDEPEATGAGKFAFQIARTHVAPENFARHAIIAGADNGPTHAAQTVFV